MWDNGVVKPHPPLHRAMEMTKKALLAAGHEVIDWEPHRHLEIYRNAETIFAADAGHDYRAECDGAEPLIQTMSPLPGALDHESYTPALEEPLVRRLVGEPYHRTAWELWQLHKEKRELRKAHLDHWESTVARTTTGRPVDAIISPAVAYTAVPHGLNSDSFYTTLCNALDLTCTVFPVTVVDPTLDNVHPAHEFHNHEDEHIYNLYEADRFPGCPVALQLIGGTLEEEAVIRMTEMVAEALSLLDGADA